MLLRAGDRGERPMKNWLSEMVAAQALSQTAADLMAEVTVCCSSGH